MKTKTHISSLTLALCLIVGCTHQSQVEGEVNGPQLLTEQSELRELIGNRILVMGKYFDKSRHKEDRYIDCRFMDLSIADYSLSNLDESNIQPDLTNGETIVVSAELHYYPGAKIPTPTELSEMEQTGPHSILTVDGKQYDVFEPKYYLMNAKLISRKP